MKEVLPQEEFPEGELPQGAAAEARAFLIYAKKQIEKGKPIEEVLNGIEEEDISGGSDEMGRYREYVLEHFRKLIKRERKELEALAVRARKELKKQG